MAENDYITRSPVRYFLYALMFVVVTGLSGVLGIGLVIGYQVFFGDDSQLKKSTILSRINEETTIYTLDEHTKIGSFFDDAHRSYVPIEEMPAHVIRAMVAAEDKNFYKHVGIDPAAIITAFGEGIVSGMHFKRGGSTITQQTVKNILDRRDHTFKRKFKEMIRALQLERMYSKAQILEFYLNQFHVTSNGKGIGIAAQHYFNKKVQDLTLVEAAFIAGSVKAPSKYNPFTKFTNETREAAWVQADQRKNYVLRRMYEQGWITKQELEDAWDLRVPFSKGKFSTEEVALVSMIRSQLNRKEILDALSMENINELDSAGLKIYTTIDSDLQGIAQLMMRRNLSRLETILEGFVPETRDKFKPLRNLEVNQYYYGKVSKILQQKGKYEVLIDFGLPQGVIAHESLERTAKFLDLPDYRGFEVHLKEMMAAIKVGDVLFVEVMEYNPDTHEAVCELRRHPTINGGIIAVDKGEVRAIVAGFEPKGYNRAMFATRQPGSVFKSVVYFGALQLGWSILDKLDNERRLFPFQGKFYFPRADHSSPFSDVSMLWAGTKSENLASVYLTANLLDKLNFGEFKDLMRKMNLLPTPGEAPADFHYRVARETGVQLDNEGIREHLLGKAITEIKPDLIFAGRNRLLAKLDKMWWGRGYLPELENVVGVTSGKTFTESELNLRIDLSKNNFKRMSSMAEEMVKDWETIAAKTTSSGVEGVFADPVTREVITRFRVMSSTSATPELAYVRVLSGEEGSPRVAEALVSESATGRTLNPLDVRAIWSGEETLGPRAGLTVSDVLLAGYLPLRHFVRIQNELERRYKIVMENQDKYNLFQYYNHHDFRIILGLKYLVNLSRAMGVYSPLEPVLSYPLGTNAVSVAEVAKIYQTFTDGKTYRYYKEGPSNQLNVIRRIEDRDGNILFEPKRQEFQLVDPCIATQMTEILSKVVTHGTGRRARGELQVELGAKEPANNAPQPPAPAAAGVKIRVPAFGKTGTTNDYTTAYFAGFVPYPTTPGAPLDTGSSYVIASYVGYDMNKTMRNGPYLISGAYGGLPVWSDFAKSLIEKKKYVEFLDTLDLNLLARRSWPMKHSTCTTTVKVDLPRGFLVEASGGDDAEVFSSTNIERDGESFVNEFERNPSVLSTVNLAVKGRAGFREPAHSFIPFAEEAREGQQPVDPNVDSGKSLDTSVDGGGDTPKGSSTPSPYVAPKGSGTGGMEPAAPSPADAATGPIAEPTAPQSAEPPSADRGKRVKERPLSTPEGTSAESPAIESKALESKESDAKPVKSGAEKSLEQQNTVDQPSAAKENAAPAEKKKERARDNYDPGFIEEELW